MSISYVNPSNWTDPWAWLRLVSTLTDWIGSFTINHEYNSIAIVTFWQQLQSLALADKYYIMYW